jgi:hypothetical protein
VVAGHYPDDPFDAVSSTGGFEFDGVYARTRVSFKTAKTGLRYTEFSLL